MPLDENSVTSAVCGAAREIQQLAPGPLADLRRRAASPAFWRLAVRHPTTIGRRDSQDRWMVIIRILAILTPAGDPDRRPPLHDSKRSLGEVLCDGGNPSWPEDPRQPSPVFSERRLAQLIAARGEQRAVLLMRAARVLARSRNPDSGINTIDIAFFLLKPDNGQRLAEPYYRRLDRAEWSARESLQESS